MTTLLCDCNQTQPLNPKALGQSLNESLTLHTTLCRREAGAFVKALQGNEPLVVACTQEQRLFGELAQQSAEAAGRSGWAPIQFVNIRETAGWSREAEQATPKIAALLAAARLPEPEPVPELLDPEPVAPEPELAPALGVEELDATELDDVPDAFVAVTVNV